MRDLCPSGSVAAEARWTLLCLSSALEPCGGAGGGLDASIEPACEGPFERPMDVAVSLAASGRWGQNGSARHPMIIPQPRTTELGDTP